MVFRLINIRVFLICLLVLLMNKTSSADEILVLADAALPSWSPVGPEFVCVSDDGILRVSSTGFVMDTLAQETTYQNVGAPLWHPDGQSIIYIRRDTNPVPGDWQVVIHELPGGLTTTWPAPGLWDDFGISFYADSSEVIFDDMDDQVWALNIKSGAVRPFLAGLDASTSPDGRWIVFLDNNDDRNILVKPITGGTSINIGKGSFPTWTVDSGYIVFTDDAGDLILAPKDGTYTAPFLTGPDLDVAGSHWGQTLVFTRCSAGGCGIWVTYLSPVPVKPMTWGDIKSIFR